jgi:hypothetical protein
MSTPRRNAFMLSSAELMLVKFGTTPVFDLEPSKHSVGLAQEIAVNLDSSNTDLTAGIAQAIVDSKRTNVQASISGSVREYTAENLLRAQGLSAAAVAPMRGKLTAAAAGGAGSLTLVSDQMPGDASSAIPAGGASIPAGATILIQDPNTPELVFPTKTSAASTDAGGTHTVAIAGPYAIPAGMSFPIGANVWVLTDMPIGSMDQNDLFSVKIVGTLANFNRPVVAVFPKVQITKGFSLSFTETEYGAMPWEMRPMLLSASEAAGRLTEVGTRAPGRLYAA